MTHRYDRIAAFRRVTLPVWRQEESRETSWIVFTGFYDLCMQYLDATWSFFKPGRSISFSERVRTIKLQIYARRFAHPSCQSTDLFLTNRPQVKIHANVIIQVRQKVAVSLTVIVVGIARPVLLFRWRHPVVRLIAGHVFKGLRLIASVSNNGKFMMNTFLSSSVRGAAPSRREAQTCGDHAFDKIAAM